jgi:hypothetical protein
MTLTQKVSTKSALLPAKPEANNAISKAYQGSDAAISKLHGGFWRHKERLVKRESCSWHGFLYFVLNLSFQPTLI